MAYENDYKENLENLRKLLIVKKIVSFAITDIICTAGSSSGDNYMSVVKRLKIQSFSNNNDRSKGKSMA